MNNNKIAHIGHPILREPTKEVPLEKINTEEIKNLIRKLTEIMHEFNGAGLAANQIYESYRICVLEIKNNLRYKHLPEVPFKVLINPKIVSKNQKKIFSSFEGCLSVPNLRGRVNRSYDIKVEYYDQNAKYNLDHIKGFQAIVYQHEIDHLDGILFTDKVKDKKSLVTYENYIKYYEEDYRQELMKLANY